jgi:hypothetical protein
MCSSDEPLEASAHVIPASQKYLCLALQAWMGEMQNLLDVGSSLHVDPLRFHQAPLPDPTPSIVVCPYRHGTSVDAGALGHPHAPPLQGDSLCLLAPDPHCNSCVNKHTPLCLFFVLHRHGASFDAGALGHPYAPPFQDDCLYLCSPLPKPTHPPLV